MSSLHAGWPNGTQIVEGPPPDDNEPFIVWGQTWLAGEIIPAAHANGRPWWCIDNGYWNSARGTATGYYRLTYRSMTPPVLAGIDDVMRRAPPKQIWRRTGHHVVLALPGESFGRAIGLDMRKWSAEAPGRVSQRTNRPIMIRPKGCPRRLADDLQNAWALVTHSSLSAIEAVVLGIPVFVEPTSAAAPVGNLDLTDMENPRMPGRRRWLQSLACQHYTLSEMAHGTAWRFMAMIREQVDGALA